MAKQQYSCKNCGIIWNIHTPNDPIPSLCINQDCLSDNIKKLFLFTINSEEEEQLPVGSIVKQFIEENELVLKDLKKEKL